MLFPTLPLSLTPTLALILPPILPLTLILTGRGPQHASWRAHGTVLNFGAGHEAADKAMARSLEINNNINSPAYQPPSDRDLEGVPLDTPARMRAGARTGRSNWGGQS